MTVTTKKLTYILIIMLTYILTYLKVSKSIYSVNAILILNDLLQSELEKTLKFTYILTIVRALNGRRFRK